MHFFRYHNLYGEGSSDWRREEFELFIRAVSRLGDLSQELSEFLRQEVVRETYAQTRILEGEGEIPGKTYFIISGAARLCYSQTEKSGRKTMLTSLFAGPGEFILNLHGFFGQKPARESIQFIGSGIVFSLSYLTVQQTLTRFPEARAMKERLKDIFMEKLREHNRILRMRRVEDRYAYIMEKHSWLFRQIPLEYIASFLNITRETLSRLRARKKET